LFFTPALAVDDQPAAAVDDQPAAAKEPATTPEQAGEVALPADGDSTVAGDHVIPPGQEELLAAMLGREATLPGDCKLNDGEVNRSAVNATYLCPGGEVVFQLAHPSKAAAASILTARFAISLVSGSPPAELAEALATAIRSQEARFEWKTLDPPVAHSTTPTAVQFIGKRTILTVAAVFGILVLGRALWRRMSARSTPSAS
jgi:hypothetical protein